MHPSPIIEELHELRRRHAERFGNDLHAICEDARRRQAEQGRLIVPARPKRLADEGEHQRGPDAEATAAVPGAVYVTQLVDTASVGYPRDCGPRAAKR